MSITSAYTYTDTDTYPMVLFNSLFSQGTITGSASETDFPLTNVGTESTYDGWKLLAVPGHVTVDMGTATSADSCAIIAHNLGTCGATVVVERSSDNISYLTSATITPTDDQPILLLFSSSSRRYWRIRISSATTIPTIGNIVLGSKLVFPGGVMPPYTPIWQAQTVELLTSKSLGGQFLGNRILRQGAETSISLVSFSRTFAEVDLQSFKSWYNGGHAFVWAAGPSVFPNDVGYVWRKPNSEMRPTFTETGSWVKVTMEVEGYVQ